MCCNVHTNVLTNYYIYRYKYNNWRKQFCSNQLLVNKKHIVPLNHELHLHVDLFLFKCIYWNVHCILFLGVRVNDECVISGGKFWIKKKKKSLINKQSKEVSKELLVLFNKGCMNFRSLIFTIKYVTLFNESRCPIYGRFTLYFYV